MGRKRRRNRIPQEPAEAIIDSLSHDGRGVARIEEKAVFVRGALPGETVQFQYTSTRRSHDEGRCLSVEQPSPDRVEPKCQHFGLCGGCSLQHLDPLKQIEAKQGVLADNLQRIGKVEPEAWLPPLTGPLWGYRRKARLGVKYVINKQRLLLGFREAGTSKVADLSRCEVLHPSVGEHLMDLNTMIASMDGFDRIPQIEVAISDDVTALIFRHLDPLSEPDLDQLRGYAASSGNHIFLQSAGPDSVTLLAPESSTLRYALPDHDVAFNFKPNDFTQVNTDINRAMVNRALALLELNPDDRVLDLFCGLGNFTLPIARKAKEVIGVEGDQSLVDRAQANAKANGIENARFYAQDLTKDVSDCEWLREPFTKMLLDPPRSGAQEMMPKIAELAPGRIVYVSCHPASLARDAGLLVHEHGYKLLQAGVMDMFPHTGHVESIAVFEKAS